MGVLHSTLQAEQNFPISIRSFFFFSPLNQWEKYTLKFTLKMGIKRQKNIYWQQSQIVSSSNEILVLVIICPTDYYTHFD